MKTLISKNQKQYKANLHCHSTISDGRLTPEQLKTAYKNAGYDILAITDHEVSYDHTSLSEPDFLLLTGYEAYIRPNEDARYDPYNVEVHINLFAKEPHNTSLINYNDRYCKYVADKSVRDSFTKAGDPSTRKYTVEYVNNFLRDAKENGYICAHNHAIWSMEDEEYLLNYEGFFSMEMCNYSSYLMNRMEYNAPLYDKLLRLGKKIYCHSADDNHNKTPFGMPGCDSFGGFSMIMANELSYSSVIEALEKGEFYSSMGPQIKELTVDGSRVHIETSPVEQITMLCSAKKTFFAIGTEDAPITSADFEIPEDASFVRFDAVDFKARHANTRGFFKDEL